MASDEARSIDLDARIASLTSRPEPGVTHPQEQLIWQFATQARACQLMGSELYTSLLMRATEDLESRGPCWRLVRPHLAPGRGNAIALRLMAAVHRLVLLGEAPELAPFYAATGGSSDPTEAWGPFRSLVEEREDDLVPLIALGCQTNEAGRAASLAIGCLVAAEHTGLPLAINEIGTAAGLNLRWDHFRYGGGGEHWGDRASPVDLSGFWIDPPAISEIQATVASRTGIDRSPIDPTSDEGWLALASSVWGDQGDRLARLRGAIELTRAVPADIVTADAVSWVEDHLAPTEGCTTVLMQSVLREYLTEEEQGRLTSAVEAAGRAATSTAPLAWVQLEPISVRRRHGLSLTLWPDGGRHELTTAGSLGGDVRRVDATST